MRLYNTLTRQQEEFSAGRKVGLYVCGVTPYDTTHLGHARTYLVFDVLVRQLMAHGHKVDYIQNITDVDESIIERARELNETYQSLGERFSATFMSDIASLGMLPAARYPKATDAIDEMHEIIRRLLATGHAYRVASGVFFRVSSSERFGELGRLGRPEMLEIESEQDAPTVHDESKEDPLDFPLWRTAEQGPTWESPWGRGRPGWHLECSTLAIRHLGSQIDIHGGGSDLVFPHHECEIAQSEAVTSVRPFARFWMHVAMVRLGGKKMSKSDGNMVFARDLLNDYSPDAIRLYLLRTHYRQPLDYREEALNEAVEAARRLSSAAGTAVSSSGNDAAFKETAAQFESALDDDLDTPGAVDRLVALAELVEERSATYPARRALRDAAARLGLNLEG